MYFFLFRNVLPWVPEQNLQSSGLIIMFLSKTQETHVLLISINTHFMSECENQQERTGKNKMTKNVLARKQRSGTSCFARRFLSAERSVRATFIWMLNCPEKPWGGQEENQDTFWDTMAFFTKPFSVTTYEALLFVLFWNYLREKDHLASIYTQASGQNMCTPVPYTVTVPIHTQH